MANEMTHIWNKETTGTECGDMNAQNIVVPHRKSEVNCPECLAWYDTWEGKEYSASRLTSLSGEMKAPPALEVGDRVKVITGGLIGAYGTVDKHEEEGLFRVELDSGGHYAFTVNELLVIPTVPASYPAAQNEEIRHGAVLLDGSAHCVCGWPNDGTARRWHQVEQHIRVATCKHDLQSSTVTTTTCRCRHNCGYFESSTPSTPPSPKTQDEEYGWALSIANFLHCRAYQDVPNWKPLPDLLGLLTQISNMVAGLPDRTVAKAKGTPND